MKGVLQLALLGCLVWFFIIFVVPCMLIVTTTFMMVHGGLWGIILGGLLIWATMMYCGAVWPNPPG